MSNIDVSVVVATYKQEKYIAMTLDSILAQKFSGTIEVLVGDDCSPDNTGAIVKEYGEKYPDIIKPIVRPKNLGAFKNFKDLMSKAQGKYIAMIEGDDYWINENKLQEQFEFMESHPDYVATFGQSIIVDENNERQEGWEQYITFAGEGEYTVEDYQNYLLPGQTARDQFRRTVPATRGFQAVCPEGVGIEHTAARLHIAPMDSGDGLGMRQIPELRELTRGKPGGLKHGAHRAVKNQHLLICHSFSSPS